MFNSCVITADIIGSKAIDNWSQTQRVIKETLRNINNQYQPNLIGKFVITVHDEFQGALKNPNIAYDILLHLSGLLPVKFRCGIGIGKIDKISEKTTEMSGEAFFRSREALITAKKSNRMIIVKSEDDYNLFDDNINFLIYMISVFQKGWTEKQKEVIGFFRRNSSLRYEEIGKNLGVTKQAVSQRLKAAHWNKINEAENIVKRLFEEKGINMDYLTKKSKGSILDKKK